MPNFLPSLEERKRQFLENCCGDIGSGSMDAMPEEGNVPTADEEVPDLVKKARNKIKRARGKR